MLILGLIVFSVSLVTANLTVAIFGPVVAPINAFVLIGLDLSLRDWLHIHLTKTQMVALILGTSVVSYLLNPASGMVAAASFAAFALSASVDWLVFDRLRNSTWGVRSNFSNVAGAAVDSVVFPTLAFGALMPEIIALQFVAKVAGGFVWSFILRPRGATSVT